MASERLEDWLLQATMRLSAAGVDSARLDAQLLAAHVLGVRRSELLAHPEWNLDVQVAERLLARRLAREPLAYIVGEREFYGRSFAVGPGVLIPRQETECLVEAVLEALPLAQPAKAIVEVGSGSGCVCVSLALEAKLPVLAIDLSPAAVDTTARNARRHGARVTTVLGNGLAMIQAAAADFVVSNPPYITEGEDLMPEVAEYEPPEALYGGADGLSVYRQLATEATRALRPSGWMAFEVGAGQAEAVRTVLEASGFEFIRSVRDLGGIERALVFRLHKPRVP